MNIDNKQFEQIRKELLLDQTAHFETTEQVVMRMVAPQAESFCRTNPCLFGQQQILKEDVYLQVRKKIVTQFFLGDKAKSEDILKEVKFFCGWVNKVIRNEMTTHYRKAKKEYEHRVDLSEEEWALIPDTDGVGDPMRNLVARETLNEVFNQVLDTKFSPHKILAWMECYMNLYEWYMPMNAAIDLFCATHGNSSIDELYYSVFQRVEEHSWFRADPLLLERMEKKLAHKDQSRGTYGNKTFADTYGAKKPQSAVSDWIYKINESIRQEIVK